MDKQQALKQLEAQLGERFGSLEPADLAPSRDKIMFLAGQAAARKRIVRLRRVVSAMAACLVISVVTLVMQSGPNDAANNTLAENNAGQISETAAPIAVSYDHEPNAIAAAESETDGKTLRSSRAKSDRDMQADDKILKSVPVASLLIEASSNCENSPSYIQARHKILSDVANNASIATTPDQTLAMPVENRRVWNMLNSVGNFVNTIKSKGNNSKSAAVGK